MKPASWICRVATLALNRFGDADDVIDVLFAMPVRRDGLDQLGPSIRYFEAQGRSADHTP